MQKFLPLIKMKNLLLILLSITICTSAHAEVTEFGGHDQRFKGNGDNTPPQCTIEYPRGSTTPFFIEWGCSDDVSSQDAIRSELWIRKLNSTRSVLLSDFLGFPASALIDENTLGVEDFVDGLPITFRLIVKDQAGNAATSESITIRSQDVTVDSCDLTVVTSATESTGSTTGLPSMTVAIDNGDVSVTDTSTSNFSITTPVEVTASTCEIDSMCNDESELKFNIVVDLDTAGNASGLIEITPGDVTAQLSGSSTTASSSLTRLDMTGSTIINGASTNISFVCTQ